MVEVINMGSSGLACLDAKSKNGRVQLLVYKEKKEYSACKCDESGSPVSEFITINPSSIEAYLNGRSVKYTTGWGREIKEHYAEPKELDELVPEFNNLIKSIDEYIQSEEFETITKKL